MEITIRNTTPEMVPIMFDNGDEYELPSEAILTLVCEPGAEIEIEKDHIEVEGVASPLETDETVDEGKNAA